MALRTASVSGRWSNTATWGGSAVPVNSDTVVINSGIVVEFDVDQSGFASGLGAMTVNGTLYPSRTAGVYYMKNAASVTWAAASILVWDDGSGGRYPQGCTFTQLLNGNFENTVNAASVPQIRCLEPTHTYALLTQAANIGDTVLNIDTDLTQAGDSGANLWTNGALVRIDNNNAQSGTVDTEERTISSLTSSTLTVTVGLTAAKPVGSFVILASRNIKIIGINAAGTGNAVDGGVNGYLAAEMRLLAAGIRLGTSHIVWGVISNCGNGGSLGSNLGHIFNGVISACPFGIVNGVGITINGLISAASSTAALNLPLNVLFTGIINGCSVGIAGPATLTGTIKGCRTGLSASSGYNSYGATLSSNFRDLLAIGSATLRNTLLGSATEFANYNTAARQVYDCVESFDHDQVSGDYRNWCVGGITSTNTGTVYGSRVRSYQHVLELPRTGVYSFRDQTILVPAGGWVNVYCFIQKDASMSYLPNLQIFPASVEPLISGSASATATMTNSISTWEVLFAKYQNTTTAPQLVKVRVIGQNASGNLYEDTDISVSPFGNTLGEVA